MVSGTVKWLLLITSTLVSCDAKFFNAGIARERLVTDLFVHYDAANKPAVNNQVIMVKVSAALQHFDFRERDGVFKFVGLLTASWYDAKLGWNPSDYNNLTKIPVSQKLIWVPDLEVYNNAPDKFLRLHRNGIVVLCHNGTVFWSDAIEVSMFCSNNMRNWPHDRHSCKLNLGSWTYHGLEIDLVNEKPLSFENIDMQNMEYKLIDYSAAHVSTEYPCCTEHYITILYSLEFERRCAFALVFRVTALSVIMLTLAALAIAPDRSEKIVLNGISTLLIVCQLIYFAKQLGNFARETPLVVHFFSCSMLLVTLAQFICVFSLMVTRSCYRGKLPEMFSKFLTTSFAQRIARVSTSKSSADRNQCVNAEANAQFEDVKMDEGSQLISKKLEQDSWTLLAIVFQRIAVLCFAFVFLILGSVCFV